MADDQTNVGIKLDLDNLQALQKLLETKSAIISLGDAQNLEGLMNGLLKVGAFAGVLGAAFFTAKAALDMSMEAETIKQVNLQFEVLTKQAGIATDTLKDGLEKASKGLIGETELLQIANKALINFNGDANKLVDVMELARKVSLVMGGSIAENFQQITMAIETGNTRLLRHLNLNIDAQKAVRDFAEANNIAVSSISEAGRQQAILNAVLEKGQSQYKNLNTNVKENTTLWEQTKVSIINLKDQFVIFFNDIFGPMINEALKGVKFFADSWAGFFGMVRDEIHKLMGDQKKLAESTDDLKERKPHEFIGQAPEEQATKPSIVDKSKQLEEESKFQVELQKLSRQTLEEEQKNALTAEQAEAIHNQMKIQLEQQASAEIEKIWENENLTRQQATELSLQIEHQKYERLKQMEADLEKQKMAAMERDVERTKYQTDAFGKAWMLETKKAEMNFKNFALLGQKSFQILQNGAANAFLEMGKGSKSGSDIMKSFVINAIADMAESEGRFMLAAGLANPGYFAAGAALLVLAGALRAQAGAAGASGGGEISGGGGGGGAASQLTTQEANRPALPVEAPKKALTVQIMGHLFETEQTRTRLMEILRETQDITDFNLVKIGQK